MSAFFIKRANSSDYLLLFLVCAAGSVFLTRLFLSLTNFPQVSYGELHIAHVIFGGLGLTISNMLFFTYHGKRIRQIASGVAGIGFGLFIDEIGKFITRENDYFYEPALMIIYLSFILLFFLYRYLDKYTPHRSKELIYEVIESLEGVAEHNFPHRVKKSIEKLINRILEDSEETYHAFAKGLLSVVSLLPSQHPKPNRYVRRLQSSWKWLDEFTAERKPVFYFLLALFLIYIFNTLIGTFSFLQVAFHRQFDQYRFPIDSRLEWIMIISQLSSQLIAAFMMTRGFVMLVRRRRLRALELFKNALAINILITHLLTFYFKQFAASFEVIISLVMFAIVHNILEEEKE